MKKLLTVSILFIGLTVSCMAATTSIIGNFSKNWATNTYYVTFCTPYSDWYSLQSQVFREYPRGASGSDVICYDPKTLFTTFDDPDQMNQHVVLVQGNFAPGVSLDNLLGSQIMFSYQTTAQYCPVAVVINNGKNLAVKVTPVGLINLLDYSIDSSIFKGGNGAPLYSIVAERL